MTLTKEERDNYLNNVTTKYTDLNDQGKLNFDKTLEWLESANRDELEALAMWLIENGHGIEDKE